MIALDTNFLVSLFVESHNDHKRAVTWFELNKEELSLTHINIGEVLRLISHPRVFLKPLTLQQAVHLVEDFISNFDVFVLYDSPYWLKDLEALTHLLPDIRANQVFDARIALILRYNGVKEICTLDSDFKKYDFLNVIGY
jgi:predicted nucleic acid-binding protein